MAYTRGKKHLKKLDREIEGSVMWQHCRLGHNMEIQNFIMSVTMLYCNNTMLRKVTESVLQGNSSEGKLINIKTKWNYANLPRVTIDEGERSQYESSIS